MPSFDLIRKTPIKRSARVMQVEGMFDLAAESVSQVHLFGSIDIESSPWSIGLILGPSGSGKTSIARELFSDHIVDGFEWPHDASIIDAFPRGMGIKEIVGALSSVGFSSPPNWLRPFHVLSNGEQFRVTIARAMCESKSPIVIDEFSSVVDRTVAKIGSHAIAKAIRAKGDRLVAVSCHYDIVDWLQPDWVYDTASSSFTRRCLRRRPDITMRVERTDRSAWGIFQRYHYLASTLATGASCFMATIDDQPAAFCAVMAFAHPKTPGWRVTRIVTLPDFQGAGVGGALLDYVGSLFLAKGKPFYIRTSHPGFIHRLAKSKLWAMTQKPSLGAPAGKTANLRDIRQSMSTNRYIAGFRYVGPANHEDALRFGVVK